jgi:DNA repair photolyase
VIISASRRTDIPAFYADWFMRRIRAGYCTVPNPFNPRQVARVSLTPADAPVIVFWTRDARPMLPHLAELRARGHACYVLYTILGMPRPFEPRTPAVEEAVATFRALAGELGADHVAWRYDPIVLSTVTDHAWHAAAHARLARALEGHTRRCIVSLLDLYRKVGRRLAALESAGIRLLPWEASGGGRLMTTLAGQAAAHGMRIQSCAEAIDLRPFGIEAGACIEAAQLRDAHGAPVHAGRDASQRAACRCSLSRDVGVYDTCRFGCVYCYATSDPARAARKARLHDPDAESLCPPPG